MIDIIFLLIALAIVIICVIALQDIKKKKVRFLVIPLERSDLLVKFQICILYFYFTIDKDIISNKRILEEIIGHAKNDGFDVSIKFKY